MKLHSTFAIIDVKRGKVGLLKAVRKAQAGDGGTDAKIPVVIRGFITREWSGDDGTSREFQVDVTKVETPDPHVRPVVALAVFARKALPNARCHARHDRRGIACRAAKATSFPTPRKEHVRHAGDNEGRGTSGRPAVSRRVV